MRITVLGGGSFGTTMASLLAGDNQTTLWARDRAISSEVAADHRNSAYLSGFTLHPELRATSDLDAALNGSELVLIAVPSPFVRTVVQMAQPFVPSAADLVSLTKGIELETGARMSEVILEVTDHDPRRVCVLSGPNLAKEMLAGHPSATVLACPDDARAERLRHAMSSRSLRVFTNRDLVGCEIGGAVKNVIAIVAGVGDGLGYGWNTKSALIARGLAEVTRLGVALGAHPMTFLGLAGNGDLIATCSSPQSRNRHVGEQLGLGRSLHEIIGEMKMVAEGAATTPAIVALAHSVGVPMPITCRVDAVLRGSLSPADAVSQLMSFEPGSELDDLIASG